MEMEDMDMKIKMDRIERIEKRLARLEDKLLADLAKVERTLQMRSKESTMDAALQIMDSDEFGVE